MKYFSSSSNKLNKRIYLPLFNTYVKTWILCICFGVIGFALPMFYGLVKGYPVPHVQDELSYTVAADTYASGRLTNPTPVHFEHFEAPHILMEPNYISKYPPMQGLFMATGQILFGHKIFGVWLSCGLMASALFWMLLAWTRPKWAITGTVLMILFIGINSYWAQSYWGGMVAAAGGALFFGGFRRLFDKLTINSTVLMTIGGFILVNSRPFEGTLTMLPPLMVLLVWLLRDKANQTSKKLSLLVFPGAIITVIGFSAMFYQYYQVTGNAFTLPYSVHHKQYYPTPLFIFQSINQSATKGNERIRKVYDNYKSPPILENFLKIEGLPYSLYLSPIYGFIYLIIALPLFFLSPCLAILLYCSLPIIIKRNKWLLLIIVTIIFTFACMSLGIWWDQYHYCASLTSCFFLLIAEGFRLFYLMSKRGRERQLVFITLIVLTIVSFIYIQYIQLYSYEQFYRKDDSLKEKTLIFESLSLNKSVEIKITDRATFFRHELEEIIKILPDRYMAVVSYDINYDLHDEIVYNKADIENAKLIWAHDLSDEKNASLFEYYNNRKILMIRVSDSKVEIKPFSLR